MKSCAALGSLDTYTFRRVAQLKKGEYSEIFPVQNARNETIYLLHEERLLSSTPGVFSVSRTLLMLTERSLKQAARIEKTGVNAAQTVDVVIPFAALLK